MIDTYLINLARRSDRLARFTNNYQLPFSVVCAFDGRHLAELTQRKLLDYRQEKILQSLRAWPHNPPQRIPGIFGCWESHLSLWSLLISNSDSNRRMLIFEDDAKPTPDYERVLRSVVSNLPNEFDLCYLGSQGDPHFQRNLTPGAVKLTKMLDDGSLIEFGKMTSDSFNTTSAYIISRNGAVLLTNYLLETLEREEPLRAIDDFIRTHHNYLEVYELIPHLFHSPLGSDSDIQI